MEKTAEKIKQFLPVFITILAVTMLFTGMACRQANNSFTNEDFIRFHVIANSDSDEDQALKLRVRDRLIEYINDGLRREAVRQSDGGGKTAELNIEETRDYIRENLGEIRQKDNACHFGALLWVKDSFFCRNGAARSAFLSAIFRGAGVLRRNVCVK